MKKRRQVCMSYKVYNYMFYTGSYVCGGCWAVL